MNKKIIKVFCLLMVFLPANASNPWDPRNLNKNSYDGPYVGLNLGLDFSENKFSSSHENFVHSSNVSFNGYLAGMLLGYGKTKNGIYIGTEISFNLFNSNKSSTTHFVDTHFQNHTLKHTIKKNHDSSISMRVGKIFEKKFLIYSKFQGGLDQISFLYQLDNGIYNINQHKKKKIPHLKLGVGVDYLITKSIALGLSYDYKLPKNIKIGYENIENKHALNTSILYLRFLYYF